MKKLIASLLLSCGLVAGAHAAGGASMPLDKFPVERVNDLAALQRGMSETVNVDIEADDELVELIERLPGDGVKDLGVAIRQVLGGDGQALVAQRLSRSLPIPTQ